MVVDFFQWSVSREVRSVSQNPKHRSKKGKKEPVHRYWRVWLRLAYPYALAFGFVVTFYFNR